MDQRFGFLLNKKTFWLDISLMGLPLTLVKAAQQKRQNLGGISIALSNIDLGESSVSTLKPLDVVFFFTRFERKKTLLLVF